MQVLLDKEPEDIRAHILFLLWRCWHLREDCVRSTGKETIAGSVQFLLRYAEEFKNAAMMDVTDTGKCSGAIIPNQPQRPSNPCVLWTGPAVGSVKLNTDASHLAGSGESSAGAKAGMRLLDCMHFSESTEER